MPGLQESGQPLAGDRPKERRAPTQGLAGVILLNNVGFQESILYFGGYVSEVVCGSCFLVGRMSVLGAVFLIVLSYFFSLLSSSIPGCQRCNFRLNGPVQELEDSIL